MSAPTAHDGHFGRFRLARFTPAASREAATVAFQGHNARRTRCEASITYSLFPHSPLCTRTDQRETCPGPFCPSLCGTGASDTDGCFSPATSTGPRAEWRRITSVLTCVTSGAPCLSSGVTKWRSLCAWFPLRVRPDAASRSTQLCSSAAPCPGAAVRHSCHNPAHDTPPSLTSIA